MFNERRLKPTWNARPRLHGGRLIARIAVVVFGLVLFWAQAAHSATLSWNPNAEPDVTGYIVYYGTSSGDYTQRIDVASSTQLVLTNLPTNTVVYFAVTAYNADGFESDFSEEVSWATTSGTTGFQTASWSVLTDGSFQCDLFGSVGQTFFIETTTNLQNWMPVSTNVFTNQSMTVIVPPVNRTEPMRFYRASAPR